MSKNLILIPVLLWIVTFPCELIAQKGPAAIVTGRITDAETGSPLENVIAFLANTPIGTSSEKDGTFRIMNVPVGTYELILSCVGYDRQTLAVRIEKPESLYYEIRLKPKPVQAKEVEITGKRPAGEKAALKLGILLFPKDSPDTYCLYGTSASKPIGIFFADSAFYMYSLDTAVVDSEKYIRLWLLYQNLSPAPYDFNPVKCVKLHVRGKRYSYDNILPVLPSAVRSPTYTRRAVGMITAFFGQSLRAQAVARAVFESWGARWANAFAKIGNPDLMWLHIPPSNNEPFYRTFRKSVNVGVMQRYLVYPENSVNGYIYFPFPGLSWKVGSSGFPEALEYIYRLEIITPGGSKIIEFTPGGV